MFVITPENRARLRDALLNHRLAYTLSEAEYVSKVLKVALGTFKKCVEISDGEDLKVKRRTLIAILRAADIAPASIGIDLTIPMTAGQYGDYTPTQFTELVGTYLIHRRSYLTARNIVRGVLQISVDEQKRCLRFEEYNNYVADHGMPDDHEYSGEIYINETRSLFSFPAHKDGMFRLMMLQSPVLLQGKNINVNRRGRVRMRGMVLTHSIAKGVWQPAASAVAIESLPPAAWKKARSMCRTIGPEDAEFAAAALELRYAEEHSTISTALLWSRLPKVGDVPQ